MPSVPQLHRRTPQDPSTGDCTDFNEQGFSSCALDTSTVSVIDTAPTSIPPFSPSPIPIVATDPISTNGPKPSFSGGVDSLPTPTSSTSSSVDGTLVYTPSQPQPTSSGVDASSIPGVRSASRSHNNAGPIAGGVIGAVILIALLVGAFLFWRKRRSKKRTAPSAEFMHHNRLQPSLSAPPLLARDMSNRNSEDEDEQLPPFSSGTFNDPIFEKLSAAAAQRQEIEQLQLYHPYRDKDSVYFTGESSAGDPAARAPQDTQTSVESESTDALRRRPSL
ncbi:hypothetical protein EUX98_g1196 [Antrodiella citrinella]|uniref:Uncharacterized protein n=1 Tax=Antrodiella citrinella TaxID=2447956 RepID=A0A4S4N3Q7_9APHY|nr:hypothetical protein EUX98_g1196 [Antrodiella citrinella]